MMGRGLLRDRSLLLAALMLTVAARTRAAEPAIVLLWPNGAPGSEGHTEPEKVRITDTGEHVVSSVHHPSITAYLPDADRATGAAIVVMPGGGHRELWVDHEGHAVARWLSDRGVAAFVLEYGQRASNEGPVSHWLDRVREWMEGRGLLVER